jgi:hypothetical protein
MNTGRYQMSSRLRHFGSVLNGRSRKRGQSLVELTMTLPILLMLFVGMVEIGWYANNYLVLLDASREAGRYGATDDPISQWSLDLSNDAFRHDCCVGAECCVGNDCCVVGATLDENGNCCMGGDCRDEYKEGVATFTNTRPEMQRYYQTINDFVASGSDPDAATRLNLMRNAPLRYFDGVACRVIYNMSPLEFDWNRDEVVISVFSYVPPYDKSTDYGDYDLPAGWPFKRIAPSFPVSGGRMPIERNQCIRDGANPTVATIDHIGFTLTGVGNSDCTPSGSYIDDPGASGYPGDPETFCGVCDPATGEFCSNHRRADGCYGSEWDPAEIENRLYEFEGEGLAGGLVLVEVFWWHDQLLALPFFSSLANPTEIYVWIMFPVSAAEPTPTP